MSIIYSDGDYTVPVANGSKRWFAPFPDNALIAFEQDYMQLLANWDESSATLDTPHPDLTTYYRIESSRLEPLGGGMVKWTETFSRIPDARIEFESYAYTFAGLETGSLGPLRFISSASYAAVTTINTTVAHGISAGDMVIVRYTNQLPNGDQIGRNVLREALTGSGSTLTVSLILDTNIVAWISVQKADIGRDPYTESVNSWLNYDYFLPGVSATVATAGDIPELFPVVIVDGDGKRTTTYTSTTAPTKASYLEHVKAGTLLIAEGSSIRRWRGNIYERVARYVRAR